MARSAGTAGRQPCEVAVVGMAVLLPGAPDLDTYWQNLVAGRDAIRQAPPGRWDAHFYDPQAAQRPPEPDRLYCRRGGFVDEPVEVEPARFGIMPTSVAGAEPDQLIALKVAAAAIADAGGPDRLPDRDRIGVVLGRGGYLAPGMARHDQRVRTAHQLVRTLGELLPELTGERLEQVRAAFTARLGPYHPESALGLVPNLTASRTANRLDLRGPAYTVDAACASSLIAVDQAVAELASGRCDAMLAGGVHHCHDVGFWGVFAQLRALSPSQRIRPFDRAADGILIGEGTGVVVLKRLADAERDGDRVYAVIRGTGVASDGRTAALATPDPGGQSRAVRAAWRAAGLDPAAPGALGLLEGHGTATPAGDAAELATVAEVFGPAGAGERAVLGSVKSMIGHAMPAAGVAGLVKAALAVHHGMLLPTLHCEDPHPALARTRFRTIGTAEPWDAGGGPRRAAVNAFGFGGINAHVVLEQAPGSGWVPALPAAARPGGRRAAAAVREPEKVLRLAADGPQELAELLSADDSGVLAAGLPDRGGPAPGCRLAVADPTAKRLALARRVVGAARPWRGRGGVWFVPCPLLGPGSPGPGRVAFVFPGLEEEFAPRVEDVADHFGLPRLGLPAEAVAVGDTGRHGTAVVAVGRLLDTALRRIGIRPDAVAGHSVGEWTAMAAAGMHTAAAVDRFIETFDPDAMRVPELAFAALGTAADRVLEALAGLDGMSGVVLSHDNAPQQSVVCGPPEPVAELVRWFRARGVLGRVLPFRSGFHTPMLGPYLEPVGQAADRFELRPPEVPVWSATTASPYPDDPSRVRALITRHLLEPVRFRPMVDAMYAAGFRVFVTMGPGQLGSLVDDTLRGREHLAVAANSPRRAGLAQLRRVAAALWADGAEPDLSALPAAGPAAAPAGAEPSERRFPAVPLNLDAPLISLDAGTLNALRAELAAGRPAAPDAGGQAARPAAGRGGTAARLASAAGTYPVLAELDALLRDTGQAVADLLAARGRATADGGAARPGRAPGTGGTGTAAAGTPRRAGERSGGGPGPGGRHTGPPCTENLRVSTTTMPYLLDHCFFRQREGWPDLEDRWPVVPATTITRHLMDAAERAAPGRVAVAANRLRFRQWVPAAAPVDVAITVQETEPGRLTASFGGYAGGVVEVADRHPAAPPGWPAPQDGRAPGLTAAALYEERWMFHGPAFQGVTELVSIGPDHIRGVITAPAAPGALLDNVGQLIGCWIASEHTERSMLFPAAIDQVRLYGPEPAPGSAVDCLIRITGLSGIELTADAQLRYGGAVWAEVRGWRDRRFDSTPHGRLVERWIERHTLSTPRPGGWLLLHDIWSDIASRDLTMRAHLGVAERARYERQQPRRRRQWLLGRIAVKDAVRTWLRERGEPAVFPAEIEVDNDPAGRPLVRGRHGRVLPPLDVSLAHRAEAAVALVRQARPGGLGAGIDIEEITGNLPETVRVALGPAERDLLAACTAADGGGSTALWSACFWAAKEAVGKAAGTGLGGRPRDFAVVAADPGALRVEVRGPQGPRTCQVHWAEVANPPGLPARRYVVAWTASAADNDEGTAK